MPTKIAIAVVEENGRFLVGRRGSDVALAGYAEFPGGKVQPGESIYGAAQRECREEAGLDVTANRLIDVILHQYDHGELELHFVACAVDPSQSSDTLSGTFHWVPRSELAAFDFPEANRSVVQRLC